MGKTRVALTFLLLPLAGSAAFALNPPGDELAAARARQAQAERQLGRLEAHARAAGNAAERIARERRAAGAAIEAAEERISAAELELRARSIQLAAFRRSLAAAERPVSGLLAGLAIMGERPPLLALASHGGVEQLVRTRILLDSTLPAVRARTAALAARLREGERLEIAAKRARANLIADRNLLAERQKRFAALEIRAEREAIAAGARAIAAGDQVLVGRDSLDAAQGAGAASARQMAAELLAEPLPPRFPAGTGRAKAPLPFGYDLPADAPVVRGMGEIDRGGVRSRGITLATARGAPLTAPADGVIRFAGPFERFDGIAVIDHGRGWFSLIVNLSTPLSVGTRVRRGAPLGRALGTVEVELSRGRERYSPAIIAGSSNALFKGV